MISLWEKQSFLKSDVLIIGAGITGLSAAATLKETHPNLTVTILEKGILPTGASTKNAGFACFGSVTELQSDIEKLGRSGTATLVAKRWQGLQKTINRLGEKEIDFKHQSGFELILENDQPIQSLHDINDLLFPIFNDQVFHEANEKITDFRFEKTQQLIENKFEGQIDTGKMMNCLWEYCTSLGVKIYTGILVDQIEENENNIYAIASNLSFNAKQLIVCSNAFTSNIIDQTYDITPGRGIVLAIKPEKAHHLKGTFHYQEGYYYFRDYYDKILFGGGRNLDFANEQTTQFEINQIIKSKLIADLNEIILPNQAFSIEMEWAGIMAFGSTKEPIVERVSERNVVAVRLGGMGVAIGSLVGEDAAKICIENL